MIKNYYLQIIFCELVIITYLSFIVVDVRWEIRAGFKTQEIEPISSDELNLIPPRPKNSVLSNEKLKKILKKKFFPSCIEVLRQYYS